MIVGWSLGYDSNWQRDIGYGVPAICDQPDCNAEIDRGLGYVCGGDPYGGEYGCGLFFCPRHLNHGKPVSEGVIVEDGDQYQLCNRCLCGRDPHPPKPDATEWIEWKLTHESWESWRQENPNKVQTMKQRLAQETQADE